MKQGKGDREEGRDDRKRSCGYRVVDAGTIAGIIKSEIVPVPS